MGRAEWLNGWSHLANTTTSTGDENGLPLDAVLESASRVDLGKQGPVSHHAGTLSLPLTLGYKSC